MQVCGCDSRCGLGWKVTCTRSLYKESISVQAATVTREGFVLLEAIELNMDYACSKCTLVPFSKYMGLVSSANFFF